MLFRYLHHGSFEAFYKVRRTIPLGLAFCLSLLFYFALFMRESNNYKAKAKGKT